LNVLISVKLFSFQQAYDERAAYLVTQKEPA